MGGKWKPQEQQLMPEDPDEPVFVLRASDPVAPETVRAWCTSARMHGVSGRTILKAAQLADRMESWRAQHRKAQD